MGSAQGQRDERGVVVDSPLIAGTLVFLAIFGAGWFFENWSWSKALFGIAAVALIVESLVLFLQ